MPAEELGARMVSNLDRFKKDLERLIEQGEQLEFAMSYELDKEGFLKQIRKQLNPEKLEAFLKTLPAFKSTYEAWYSESLALLRQLLPDRINNFVSLYEKPRARKSIEYGNYVIQDYMQGLGVTRSWSKEVVVGPSAAIPQFQQQLAILKAASNRFESSLFEIRQLVQADLFDSEIDLAKELLKAKFLRPAGVIAGVVLEKHLRQVCNDHEIKITKKNPSINDLNELLKSGSIIEVPQWRHISMLADIRNLCAHNKEDDPSSDQVEDLINGTAKVMKTIA
jgi:hypothetical protein